MKMKEALQIMSENPNGTFQWMDQLLSLLANMGVDGIHADLTPKEVIKIVDGVDKPIRDNIMSVNVVFREIALNRRYADPQELNVPEDDKSRYLYYGFSAFLIVTGILITATFNSESLDPATKLHMLNFIVEVIRTFKPT